MKIFVAVPTYDGKPPIQTVSCLMNEKTLAGLNGDDLLVSFLPDCSVPAAGRNQLVEDFLKSGFDKLFFVDSDVTFELGALLKLAHKPVDVVGGCYRYKHKTEYYPVTWLDKKELQWDENKLLEVAAIPTGFLCLSRNVFEKFKKAYPGREYGHMGKQEYAYFQMVFKDGEMHSDDTFFCREWREAGGKVFLDPMLTLTHWDFKPTPYEGHIGNWLKNKNGITKGAENAQTP